MLKTQITAGCIHFECYYSTGTQSICPMECKYRVTGFINHQNYNTFDDLYLHLYKADVILLNTILI